MSSELCIGCIHDKPSVVTCKAGKCRAIGEHGGPESPVFCKHHYREEPVSICVECGGTFSVRDLDKGYCANCLRLIYFI